MGPAGYVELQTVKVICAQRHIHMNNIDARALNVTNGQKVQKQRVNVACFDEVIVRVSDKFCIGISY